MDQRRWMISRRDKLNAVWTPKRLCHKRVSLVDQVCFTFVTAHFSYSVVASATNTQATVMSALTASILRTSPNTPIRATTSNLSLRSAPPVPPASQNYEPLVKGVLQKRLVSHLFPYSAIFTWATCVVSSICMQGGMRQLGLMGTLVHPLRPSTLALTAFTWGLSVVPVIVVRKRYSSGEF